MFSPQKIWPPFPWKPTAGNFFFSFFPQSFFTMIIINIQYTMKWLGWKMSKTVFRPAPPLKSVEVSKLQVAILARSSWEMSQTVWIVMSQTVCIVWKHILSQVCVSVRPSNFFTREKHKTSGNRITLECVYLNEAATPIVASGTGRRNSCSIVWEMSQTVVSTDSISSHEFASQFGLAIFYTQKTPKTSSHTRLYFNGQRPASSVSDENLVTAFYIFFRRQNKLFILKWSQMQYF